MGLQALRLKNGLSQNKLADLTNISVRTIQQYEVNARNINGARLDKLVRFAIVLNCDITELLTNDELISECRKVKL